MSGSTQQASSSLSTGGAGTFFERDVAAYWLAQLLLRWIPPILIETNVIEVSFQIERLGWKTDDFLITCEGEGAARQKLIGQVKRTFTVSGANEKCRKVMLDFWQDFNSPDRFSEAVDRFALVVQRGTNALLGDFNRLLECARAAQDGDDFTHRLATPGFISSKAARYGEEIYKILGEHEGRVIGPTEAWPFFKVLHVLSLDLGTSTRQMESHICGLLAYAVSDRGGKSTADSSWNELLRVAESAMAQARTLRREDLPMELQHAHGSLSGKEEKILRALKEHSAPILRNIRANIGPDFHLPRPALVQQVLDNIETAQVVIVSGPAGSGKSAIAKEVFAQLAADHFAFAFRAEEFCEAHIDKTLNAAQVPGNAEDLAAVLAPKSGRSSSSKAWSGSSKNPRGMPSATSSIR